MRRAAHVHELRLPRMHTLFRALDGLLDSARAPASRTHFGLGRSVLYLSSLLPRPFAFDTRSASTNPTGHCPEGQRASAAPGSGFT